MACGPGLGTALVPTAGAASRLKRGWLGRGLWVSWVVFMEAVLEALAAGAAAVSGFFYLPEGEKGRQGDQGQEEVIPEVHFGASLSQAQG